MFGKKFDIGDIYGGTLGRMDDEYNAIIKEFNSKKALIQDDDKFTRDYQIKQLENLQKEYMDKINSLKSKYHDKIISDIDKRIDDEKQKSAMNQDPLISSIERKLQASKDANWVSESDVTSLLLYKLWQSVETSNKLAVLPGKLKNMNAEQVGSLYEQNKNNDAIKSFIENHVNSKVNELKSKNDINALSPFLTLLDGINDDKVNTPLKQLETAKAQLQIRMNNNERYIGHELPRDIKQDLGVYEIQKAKYFEGNAGDESTSIENWDKGIVEDNTAKESKKYETIKNIMSKYQQDKK
ncbi:hypothetical protein ACYUJ6_02115 [Clostridium sp. JNZ X4-2]